MLVNHRYLLLGALLYFSGNASTSAAPRWWTANSEGLEVYSNASKGMTKRVIGEFHNARQTLKQLFPYPSPADQFPIRLVICKDQATVKIFSPLYDEKPKELTGSFFHDNEGPIMVVCVSRDFGYTRATLYHEYIHYLTASPQHKLPAWLNEGVADLFATITINRNGRAIVGKSSQYRLASLDHKKLIPLERLFRISRASPEYNSSSHGQGTFYAQSWLLLHYIHFGDNDFPNGSLRNIINHAIDGKSFDEDAIHKLLGVSYTELEKQLKNHLRKGKFNKYVHEVEHPPFEKEIELTEASKGQIDLIIGTLLLRLRTPRDAHSFLVRASEAMPSSPRAAAYQGYHAIRQDQLEYADSHFEKAISNGSQSAFTYLSYAYTKVKLANPNGDLRQFILTEEETVEILKLLYKARELAGGFSESLYHLIGHTWLCSSSNPSNEEMQVLIEGLKQYPDDERITFYLAVYLHRIKDYDGALNLLERFNDIEISPETSENIRVLRELIAIDLAEQ